MIRRIFAASVLLLPAAAHAALNYGVISYTDIADTFAGSPYKQFGNFPSINNAGQTAFTVLTTSNIERVLLSPVGAGPLINIADTTATFSDVIRPTVNNNGVVAFGGTNLSGQTGIYNGAGAAITTVADASTSSHPYYSGGTARVNDSGSTLFLGYGSSGEQQFIVGNAGSFTTIIENNHAQFEYLSDAAINNSGQVAFNTDDYTGGNNNGAYVYRYTPGIGLTKIARAASTTSVSINNAGTLAFQATGGSGNFNPTLGIFSSDGATTTHISDVHQNLPGTSILIDSYAANGEGTSINSTGLVAIQASDNSLANYGIYVGDGTNTTTLVHLGQSLFGKTVTGFDLGTDSINDAGQVTFSVFFSDNTSAIVRSSGTISLPEPASLSLLALGTTTLFSRRRRA